jgi:hypothetical protein
MMPNARAVRSIFAFVLLSSSLLGCGRPAPRCFLIDHNGSRATNVDFDLLLPVNGGATIGRREGQWLILQTKDMSVTPLRLPNDLRLQGGVSEGKIPVSQGGAPPKPHNSLDTIRDLYSILRGRPVAVRRAYVGPIGDLLDYNHFPPVPDARWGFVDVGSSLIISPRFSVVGRFEQGLAPAAMGGKWARYQIGEFEMLELQGATFGLIDQSGEYKVGPSFSSVSTFTESLAKVAMGNPAIAQDEHGTHVNLSQMTFGPSGREMVGRQFGFVDEYGEVVIDPVYTDALGFSEGLAPVKKGDVWGYVDASGHTAVRARFAEAHRFSEGLAAVKRCGAWGFIDKSGEMVVNPIKPSCETSGSSAFEAVGSFHHGAAPVRFKGRWGFINREGVWVAPAQYEGAGDLHEGLAWVQRNGLIGYVDAGGKTVISPRYRSAGDFSDGFANVCQ